MAPPKTYRNISTNITGWITVNTRYAGTRIQTSRLRRVIVSVSLTAHRLRTSRLPVPPALQVCAGVLQHRPAGTGADHRPPLPPLPPPPPPIPPLPSAP